MFSLVIDNRERALFFHIDIAIKNFKYEKMQLNTGDYLILQNNKTIKACIERKTYNDFAASFRDGRYKSELANMIKLREETNCQLFFIIEGNAFPAKNSKFSRIPYACILGAINKLMLYHNIFIIQTKNEEHTAQKLNELLTSLQNIYIDAAVAAITSAIAPVTAAEAATATNVAAASEVTATDESAEDEVATTNTDTEAAEVATIEGGHPSENMDASKFKKQLTARHIRTDEDICLKAWSTLDGISLEFSKILITKFSIKELIMGEISIKSLSELKTALGRKINKDAIASLTHVYNKSPIHCAKMLSAIVGITKEYAENLLKVRDIQYIINNDIKNDLVNGKKVGIKKDKINALLCYKK